VTCVLHPILVFSVDIISKDPSIILGDHSDQFIRSKLTDGKYSSAREVISNGLLMLEQEPNLREKRDYALILSNKSGTPKVFYNDAFKANIRENYYSYKDGCYRKDI